MGELYDCEAAKNALSDIFKICELNPGMDSHERLSVFKPEKFQVQQLKSPHIYKLVKYGGDSPDLEEATFTIHGIILEKDLPPIKPDRQFLRDESSKKRYAGFVRQYVAVTGFNLEAFNQALEGIGKIHRFFEDVLPDNCLEPMVPFTIDDNAAMACHTRYFLRSQSCKTLNPHKFGPGVDPNGDLEKLQGSLYVHTEENAVQYLGEKKTEEKSKYDALIYRKKCLLISLNGRYFNINPIRFQTGDIVEVKISFFCVPTRTKTLKMLTSLRAIVLVDDSHREKARGEQIKASLSKSLKTAKLHVKRTFMQTESDDEVLSGKCARMDI